MHMSFKINSAFGRNNGFSFLQRLSQSFMLPIAMMPIAGFLLAIGSSFTQDITVAIEGDGLRLQAQYILPFTALERGYEHNVWMQG